jgi:hypothetical protein
MKTITLLHKSHQVGERPTAFTFFHEIFIKLQDNNSKNLQFTRKMSSRR